MSHDLPSSTSEVARDSIPQPSLNDELRAFLDENSGDGSLCSTPSEFVRALIREKTERPEAEAFRQAVLAGYDDVVQGRTLPLQKDLRAMVAEARKRWGE